MKKLILALGIFVFTAGAILIMLPHVYIHKTVAEEYQVPRSVVLLHGWIWAPPLNATPAKGFGMGTYLNASDSLNIQVNATAGMGVDFYVNAVNQSTNDVLATCLFFPDATALDTDWVVPLSSWYAFEFSGSSLFTRDDVSLLVTKQWTESAYRDVIEYYSLVPFEATYVGILLVIAGIAGTIYGVAMRKSAFATIS